MPTTVDHLEDPELLAAEWDLEPLVNSEGPAGVEDFLGEASALASSLQERYAGHIAQLDADELAEAMRTLERVHDLAGRAASYAGLKFSTDTADPARGALLQKAEERSTELQTKLLFFELEWAALGDEHAERLLSAPSLEPWRHHLRSSRRYRPHLLSEPEERILAEKAISSQSAWGRLFSEHMAALRVSLDGEETSLEVALSRLQSPERGVRRAAASAVSATLDPGVRTRSFIYNTLIHDKAVEDRLRSYPHWLSSRNLDNEASDESVDALINAVRQRYDLPQRWYRLKAKLLGLDKLADYDRVAPLGTEDTTFSFGQARDLVLDTYSSFNAEAGRIAKRFFEERWIDAPVRPHKRGGAFCSYAVPSAHPYILLNFTARRRDVLTMAHELGHGLHASLSARQGIYHYSTPLTLAETASVFGEALVFGRLLEGSTDPTTRLGLLAERIDGTVATVFRQMALNRFEYLAHTRRRSEGELSVARLGEFWSESQREMFGDSVEMSEGYVTWWSYIPHFINVPGYVYAYAYGQLFALSAYRRYVDEGDSFVPRYLELLGAGGSRSPEELAGIVGIDLADPGFWDAGLRLVEEQLTEAEQLAQRVS